jgi:pimeloyl-ACP methyl ester carboxylesterase
MTGTGRAPRYAVTGLGVLAGPQPDKSQRVVAAEAARLAIDDAGLKREDIGGAIDPRRSGGGGDRGSYADAFPRVLGLPVNFYFQTGRGGALARAIPGAQLVEIAGARHLFPWEAPEQTNRLLLDFFAATRHMPSRTPGYSSSAPARAVYWTPTTGCTLRVWT